MASHLAGEPRTSKQIALKVGVSDGTVKTAYKFLYMSKDSILNKQDFPEDLNLDKLPVN